MGQCDPENGCMKHKFPQVVYPPNLPALYFLTSGLPGCRNIRDGGDTVCEGESGPFLVYLVHRSFKRPSHTVAPA